MTIWKRIQHLSGNQLLKFGFLFLGHPLQIIPAIRATKRTFEICNTIYGNKHHRSNKANAFRHALWNVLICRKAYKNKQKSVFWAQKVTELYEKVTNNAILDEAMDLHNNAVGRLCFLNHLDKTEIEMIHFLQEKAENAIQINSLEEIQTLGTQLVYIHD